MRAKDLKVDILDRIAKIQQRYLDLIRPGLEVHEEYGLSRSFRRGSNSEVQYREVSDKCVSLPREFLRYSQALLGTNVVSHNVGPL